MYKTLPIVTFDMIVRVYENESGMELETEAGNENQKWKNKTRQSLVQGIVQDW